MAVVVAFRDAKLLLFCNSRVVHPRRLLIVILYVYDLLGDFPS